ncbi:MAG: SusC/RagA family TonB-linked outer membrane protein, partial [Candidatus Nephrothrix sp. EaCA]
MKCKIRKQEVYAWLMKGLALHFFLLFSISSFAAIFPSEGQGVLQRKVSVSAENMMIKNILEKIEETASIRFAYQANQVNVNRKASIFIEDMPLGNVLTMLFDKSTLFEAKGDLVVIRPVSEGLVNRVTGRVTDSKTGEPLPGVNVVATGTSIGTVTDTDGRFALEIPANVVALTFTFIGFQSQTVDISNQTTINVQLTGEITKLDEIVVVAFGAKQKAMLIESVDKVDDKFIKNRPVNNVLSGLQGQVAGVNITQSSGQPGVAPSINIRGVGSLQSGTGPLIIIDGVPGTINLIDPNDVESISVLKDAAASSIYGARAANGVVIVTTKKAKSGKVSVSYAGY